MDLKERIANVEAEVESHHEQLDRIKQEIIRLRERIDQGLAELREHTDQGLAELREHTDQGLAELREHTDQGLAELREHTDRGFDELRKELAKVVRWQIGTTITLVIAMLGIAVKVTGIA
ncbi:hypothetical protein [Pseudoduganella sp. RAF53_2]|uniref:hypothetical protein n=1 Tax=unclassified Pseudoduganella TaxID=2637179 RepID=UPI003F993C31